MAGTFYRASRPGGEPLAREGSWTAAGAPLCVIEAMKMMTEVAAEAGGTIVRALCEDGQTVEQGQALFIIEPGEAPHVS
jgi:acetyl-CoA carboxylase biotin carboxyl carrier protein